MNTRILVYLLIVLFAGAVLVATTIIDRAPTTIETESVNWSATVPYQVFENPVPNGMLCFSNEDYLVVVQQNDTGLQTPVTVVRRFELTEPIQCTTYTDLEYTFNLNLASDTFVFGLVGDYLILDIGTGPSNRNLAAYDLITKDKVYGATYADLELREPDLLTYWQVSNEPASDMNCPEFATITAQSFTPQLQIKTTYALNAKATITGEERCVATQ